MNLGGLDSRKFVNYATLVFIGKTTTTLKTPDLAKQILAAPRGQLHWARQLRTGKHTKLTFHGPNKPCGTPFSLAGDDRPFDLLEPQNSADRGQSQKIEFVNFRGPDRRESSELCGFSFFFL